MNEDAIRKHVEELQGRSDAYRLFAPLPPAEPGDAAAAALRSEVGGIVDLAFAQELAVGDRGSKALTSLLALGTPPPRDALAAWRLSLEAAFPSRKAMHRVLYSFADWLARLDPAARSALLPVLPKIMPALCELKDPGVEETLGLLSRLAVSGRESRLASVTGYGATSGAILLGVLRLLAGAARWNGDERVAPILTAASPETVVEDEDCEALLPAAGTVSKSAEENETLWTAAIELVAGLAAGSASSALVTARDLPDILGALSPETAVGYAQGFASLARELGLGVVGFGRRELPGLYHSLEHGRDVTDHALEIRKRYGVQAAMEFLQGGTEAARKLLTQS